MIRQIPFEIIEEPIIIKDVHITKGYQLRLSEKVEYNDIEIGNSPFFVTTRDHNFISDPVMIYTFVVDKSNALSLESEAISSSLWISETNQPFHTGFIWPNIDSYMMLGFQPDLLLVMKTFTHSHLIDPIMNIRCKSV